MSKAIGLVSVLALICLTASVTAQTTRTWDAAAGVWSDDGNWNPAGALTGGDSVTFGETGSGGANTNDIAELSLVAFDVLEGQHTTDLNAKTLTIQRISLHGVGLGTNATLNLTDGNLAVVSEMQVGATAAGDAFLRLGPDVALQVGQESARASIIRIGQGVDPWPGSQASRGSNEVVVGQVFNAWVTNLTVGVSATLRGGSGSPPSLFDLRAVTNDAVLDVANNVLISVVSGGNGDVVLSDKVHMKVGSPSSRGGLMRVGYSAAGKLRLGAGRFDAYATELSVGRQSHSSLGGFLHATNVVAGVLDVRDEIGIAANTSFTSGELAGILGEVLLSDGIAVKFGQDENTRARFGMAGHYSSIGKLTVGANSFHAYLTNFWVCATGSANGNAQSSRAEINLAAVTNGLLDVVGVLRFGRGTSPGGNPGSFIRLSDHFVTRLGTPSFPLSFEMGIGGNPTAFEFKAGGTFHAYLTHLTNAWNTSTGTTTREHLIDLSSVTNGILNIAGNMTVAMGPGLNGTVRLNAFEASAANIYLGSTNTGSKGTVDMTSTVFSVSGNVVLDGPTVANKARVLTTVTETPAGLDLGSAASLTVNQGLIHIIFKQPTAEMPPPHYWGLRWEGNKVTELTALAAADKLTWDDSDLTDLIIHPVQIYQSGGYTYVGARMGRRGTILTIR